MSAWFAWERRNAWRTMPTNVNGAASPAYTWTLRTVGSCSSLRATAWPAARASSFGVPSGRSSCTMNSDLLSNGSIFTLTTPRATRDMEPRNSTPMAAKNPMRTAGRRSRARMTLR